MSGARLSELFANIKNSFVSFFSIIMFVTLGVGVFLGIQGSAESLSRSADRVFDADSFHNFEVAYPYGITREALDAIAGIDGVTEVVPQLVSYERQLMDGFGHPISVNELTDGIDITRAVEGRLPERKGEIGIGVGYAKTHDIKVGDTFELVRNATDEADSDGMTYLTTSTFEVVGLVTNPSFISKIGGTIGITPDGLAAETFTIVSLDSFDADAFRGAYPKALVRVSSLDGLPTFSEEYQRVSKEVEEAIVAVGEPFARARYDELHDEAQAKIDDAQAQIDSGEQILADANQQMADGEIALIQGQAQVDAALAQLESGQASYDQIRSQGQEIIDAMEASLSKLQSAYDVANAELVKNQDRVAGIRAQVESVSDEVTTLSKVVNEQVAYFAELDIELTGGVITQEEYAERRKQAVDVVNAAAAAFQNAAKRYFPAIAERYPALMEFPQIDADDVDGWIPNAQDRLAEYAAYASGAATMLADAEADLARVKGEADALKSQLDSGWSRLESARSSFESRLAAAASQLESGRHKAAEGQATIDEKTKELEEGKKTVEEKAAELEAGKEKLAEARSQVDSMAFMSWIVSSRRTSSGVISLDNIARLTRNLRVVMASLFVVVGLLVCYSAISRIVHDHVRAIGTKKALGFRPGEITGSYLAYTAIAVLIGTVLGIFTAIYVVEGILYPGLAQSFVLDLVSPSVSLPDVAFIFAVEMGLLLLITWLACRSILKRSAIELLAGEETASATTRFYERWPIWRRLPLLTQTVINNCVNDPRRVFATVIGVAGCTALIVTAATLDLNIARSLSGHFGRVYEFDSTVRFDAGVEGARERVEAAIDDFGAEHTTVLESMFLLEDDSEPAFATVIVPEDEASFSRLFHLNAVPSKGTAPVDGVWVSRSFFDHRGIQVGDVISICTVTGERYNLTVSGFFEYFVPYNTIVMSPDFYRRAFDRELVPNAFYASNPEGKNAQALGEAIRDVDGFSHIKDEVGDVEEIIALFKGITTTVVIIYIGLAAVMALIVLLNLDYMFIDEKKRELIVLIINGYSTRDAKGYIYRDAIVMTILGIILGVILGIVMGVETVKACEWQSCSFMKDPNLTACLLGAGLSAAFAIVMMLVALRRIPRFALTDISRY